MEQVTEFIENTKKKSEYQRSDRLKEEKLRAEDIEKLIENFTGVADQIEQSRKTIDKNLSSIMSYKYNVKIAGESTNQTGLPISNAHHGKFVDIISKAMSFVNVIGDNKNFETENIVDEFDLTNSMQIRNENMMQEIRREKNMIEEVETVIQRMSLLKENVPQFIGENSFFESSLINDCDT